jgi:two-component system LytT family response regulator
MKIRCLAIDDEPLALKQIGGYIRKTPFLELVSLCNNALDAMSFMENDQVDLIFVDINMPDLSGMDFVRSLRIKPFIVFTTAYSEYAIEGFRVDATDYLLKPIGYKDFLVAANKVKARFDQQKQPGTQEQKQPRADHLFVKSGYKLIRIELSDIKYIEGMHEYVRLHLASEKPIMTLASMKSIEEQLPQDKFLRVHRSYIVNKDRVKTIERNRIVFENNVYIPVSDQYRGKFQEFLNNNFLA